ncbi:HK97 family phage portal protein [Pseudomonas citronellolis]|uniref:phage portal protein n=1 Tax=Pseudomonas citronellolis TaxID=53408 RepID=UPI000E2F5890|nr:phage portal protein [Pseudomonas citronellolis]GBL59197.1 HK97 family phage portal protein [Pseudomonas citronellolis]
MNWLKRLNPLRRKGADGMTSRDLLEMIAAGSAAVSGIQVNTRAALRYAPFFACLKVLSEDVGKLPVKLFKARPTRGSDVATTHKVHRLISRRPNGWMTASEFWEMCTAHMILRGNFYAWKNVVGEEVVELLPLNPDYVKPKLREDWTLVYDVTFANGKRDILPADQIFHVRALSLDGVRGLGALEYARECLGFGIAAERHGAKLFQNGANPGGVLETENILTDEVFNRVRDSWNEKHQGLENSHKVAILEGGLKWASVTMTNVDAQWLENRKLNDSQICGLMRVPPHKVAILDRSTNNNIEQQAQDYINDALLPICTRIESRIRISLLNERDEETHFAKFNVTALLRGDMNARRQFYKDMVYIGAFSPNDVLELEDRNPREGGDIYLTPTNMNINGRPANES